MGTGMRMSIQDQDRCKLEREEKRDCLLMPVVLARLKRMMYFGGIFRLLSGFRASCRLLASGRLLSCVLLLTRLMMESNRAYHRSENSRDLI